MSERPSFDHDENRSSGRAKPEKSLARRVGVWLLAGGVAVGASIAMKKAETYMQEETTRLDSKIIAGVDAGVVGHREGTTGGRTPNTVRELILKQCVEDVTAAGEGKMHQRSLTNPDADCYYDTMKVTEVQYADIKDGQVITPEGTLGEHLKKDLDMKLYDDRHPVWDGNPNTFDAMDRIKDPFIDQQGQ